MTGNGGQTPGSNEAFCTSCGSVIPADVSYCPECNAEQLTIDRQQSNESEPSRQRTDHGGEKTQTIQTTEPVETQKSRNQEQKPVSTEPATVEGSDEIYIPNNSGSETNCQRCGTGIKSHEWFCSFCGKERPMCPDCGAEMDDESCKNCDTNRKAPCGNCGLTIDASLQECPNCGYNESDSVANMSAERKKKALGLGGVGGVSFLVVSVVVPGPTILGVLFGTLVGGPFALWGGVIAFYYDKKESNADDRTAADLSKGREQHKTKEWRDMKREERKEMLRTAAQGLNAAGKAAAAYEEKKRKEQKEEKLDERIEAREREIQQAQEMQVQTHEKMQQAEQQMQQAEQKKKQIENSVADVPRGCPRCGVKLRGSGGMMSSKNYEELAPGVFQCLECGREINLG